MNTKRLFLISLMSLILVSCDFSTKVVKRQNQKQGILLRAATHSINDVDYLLKNYIDYKNTTTTSSKGFQLENKFVLYGFDQVNEKIIYQSEFENKIDLKNIEKLVVDSISFSINENIDKIDLKYFLNLGDKTKTVMFELLNDGETWNIN